MARIYIAGTFEDRYRLRFERARLEARGHTVVSTWLDEEGGNYEDLTSEQAQDLANRDLAEIRDSNLFLLDTLGVNERGGREVELGYARLICKVFIIGPRRNLFHHLFLAYPDWSAYFRTTDQGRDISQDRVPTIITRVAS